MIQDIYPLAPLQRGILFDSLASPETDVYLRQFVYSAHGFFDVDVFKAAWQQVISRHTSLRTSFVWEGIEECRQIVHDDADLPVTLEDWRALDPATQTQRLDSFLSKDRRLGLNLEQAPLMRFAVFHLADDEYRIVWTGHHVVFDGGSVDPLLRELSYFYEGRHEGRILELPQPRQYRDYIEWLSLQDMQQAEAFWRRELSDFSGSLLLPWSCSFRSKDSGRAEQRFAISKMLLASLQGLAREKHLTVNTLLQGSWGILLGRYGSSTDVIFGATLSVRPSSLPGAEEMVGLFINTLPVRARIDRGAKALPWLQRLQSRQAEARDYGYTALSDITKWSGIASGASLFESILVVENYSRKQSLPPSSSAGAVAIRPMAEFGTSNYPLNIIVAMGTEFVFRVSYEMGRLPSEMVGQIVRHWQVLLEGIVARPEEQIGVLPLLSAEERGQLLVEWNRTERQYPQQCVHELFEEQAKRNPEAVAIVYAEQRLNYRELNEKTARLARYLVESGIGVESRVGIYVHRSMEMMIALLGVLKAGGTYVPLDPGSPKERLEYLMKDAGIESVLVESNLIGNLPLAGVDIVEIDGAGCKRGWLEELGDVGLEEKEAKVGANNVAYILYTSGSTGKPKGVMVSQSALSNYIRHAVAEYLGNEIEGSVVNSALGFDATLTTLLPPLVVGKSVELLSEDESTLSQLAHRLFVGETARLFKITPTHLQALEYEERAVEAGKAFHRVVIGGEQLGAERLKKWKSELLPNAIFVNEYGPTETVVGCSISTLVDDAGLEELSELVETAVPIGRPIENTQLYVLEGEEHLQLQPPGSEGELYIGGEGLAHGYLNQPDLTAERFIPNPFTEKEGSRLYRTGDLVKRLPNGQLLFVGRRDEQVKIRGFRIELGEIEHRLTEVAGVSAAAVIAREDEAGEKRLVAYVVPSGREWEQGEVVKAKDEVIREYREVLAARLPGYMVPTQFALVKELPRTANGKLDRHALASVAQPNPPAEGIKLRPRNGIEARILQMWTSILGVEGIGVRDDFFELGGDSIKAMMLMSRLTQLTGKSIPVKTIFEHRTIERIAGALLSGGKWSSQTSVVPIQPNGPSLPFFCIHPGGGLVNAYIDLARHMGTDQPFYAIQAYGAEHGQTPFTSVEDMARQYIKDIKEIQPEGPYQIGGWSFGSTIAYEMAQQLEASGEEACLVALLDGVCNTTQTTSLDDRWEEAIEEWIQAYFLGHSELDLQEDAERFETAMKALCPEERYKFYLETGKRLDKIPPYVQIDEFRRFMHTYAINVRAWRAYVPAPYSGKVTLFMTGCEEDDKRTETWRELALGGAEVYRQPGRHNDFIHDPHVRVLAENLRECMRRLQRTHPNRQEAPQEI